jgi:hypothetical protein
LGFGAPPPPARPPPRSSPSRRGRMPAHRDRGASSPPSSATGPGPGPGAARSTGTVCAVIQRG